MLFPSHFVVGIVLGLSSLAPVLAAPEFGEFNALNIEDPAPFLQTRDTADIHPQNNPRNNELHGFASPSAPPPVNFPSCQTLSQGKQTEQEGKMRNLVSIAHDHRNKQALELFPPKQDGAHEVFAVERAPQPLYHLAEMVRRRHWPLRKALAIRKV